MFCCSLRHEYTWAIVIMIIGDNFSLAAHVHSVVCATYRSPDGSIWLYIDKTMHSNNSVHIALSAIHQHLSEFCTSLLSLGIRIRVDKTRAVDM